MPGAGWVHRGLRLAAGPTGRPAAPGSPPDSEPSGAPLPARAPEADRRAARKAPPLPVHPQLRPETRAVLIVRDARTAPLPALPPGPQPTEYGPDQAPRVAVPRPPAPIAGA